MIVPTCTFSWWQLKVLGFCDNELNLGKLRSATWLSCTVPCIKLTHSYYSFVQLTVVVYRGIKICTIVSVNSHMNIVARSWVSDCGSYRSYLWIYLSDRQLH